MIKGSQTERVYNFVKSRRVVTMHDVYKKFPREKRPSLRRSLFVLKEMGLVVHVSEWKIN